jgi:hypothetical protein
LLHDTSLGACPRGSGKTTGRRFAAPSIFTWSRTVYVILEKPIFVQVQATQVFVLGLCYFLCQFFGWTVGQLVGWLVCWLVGSLNGSLFGLLVG